MHRKGGRREQQHTEPREHLSRGISPKNEIPLGKLEVNDLTVTVSVIRRAFWFVQNDG